jgi:hypothetical protein
MDRFPSIRLSLAFVTAFTAVTLYSLVGVEVAILISAPIEEWRRLWRGRISD